jgi:hypothetical protein
MKGVSLPINVIVILMLAVAVLAGVLYMYRSGWQPGAKGVGLESAKNAACLELVSKGCTGVSLGGIKIGNFDADKDGTLDPGIKVFYDSTGAGGTAQGGDRVVTVGSSFRMSAPGTWPGWASVDSFSTGVEEDNLFTLCRYHYGCSVSVAALKDENINADIGTSGASFNNCCRKELCGC